MRPREGGDGDSDLYLVERNVRGRCLQKSLHGDCSNGFCRGEFVVHFLSRLNFINMYRFVYVIKIFKGNQEGVLGGVIPAQIRPG